MALKICELHQKYMNKHVSVFVLLPPENGIDLMNNNVEIETASRRSFIHLFVTDNTTIILNFE